MLKVYFLINNHFHPVNVLSRLRDNLGYDVFLGRNSEINRFGLFIGKMPFTVSQ